MAETLLSFGLQKLWELLVRESDRFVEVDAQFTELKSKLNLLKSFLKDADAKKHTSETVKHFVEEIKEIVLDTEDIIETFLLKEELRKRSCIKQRMRRLSCIILDHRKIALEISGITKRISQVISDMQSFGVQQFIVQGSDYSNPLQERQREMRKTFPGNNENDLVGFEENVNKLLGYLVEEDSIKVVSITGMGGIGKTTLARQVFSHEMVKKHFDGIAWVCISQQFERTYVWQMILQQLSSKHDEPIESNMSEDYLQKKLFLLLETNKYLIILDDMWKEDDWDRIKPAFPSKKGWKVLLTSRNERVAFRADPTCVTFKPESLTIEESWTLFRRIAFPKNDTLEYNVHIDEEMEEMGNKMIKHCGGLPLALKVLGGLLVAQHRLCEWKRVYENIGSHIIGRASFNDRNINSIYHILYLSFEELPVYLKQCFLYLAHFPEDCPINVGKLSYYLAAEGIIPKTTYGASIEEVGNGYIEELVKRNMVISERDVSTPRFETFRLRDMMREVCLRQAEEENFVHIVGSENTQSPCKSRRIAVPKTYHLKWDKQNPKLRSIWFMDSVWSRIWMESGLCFTRLQLMRVLDFSIAKFEGGKLPSGIGKLIHLRYLSLFGANVTHLPSSMRNLKELLYLNLYVDRTYPLYMPNFMTEMRKLAYLCLPLAMHDKTKLEMGNLVNLETLLNFSTKNSNMRDLQRMTKLRKLSIYIKSKMCNLEILSSSLSELRHLEDLSVYLRVCHLEEDPMPILEKLVQLKELHLDHQSFSGKRIVCSSRGFPRLQKPEIYGLDEWEEWIVEEASMPLLHALSIGKCPKLKKLPTGVFAQLQKLDLDGLDEWEEWTVEEGSMSHLQTLNIKKCRNLKKLPASGFPQLEKLEIDGLDEWEEWIVEEGSMPFLHTLGIHKCPKLKKLPTCGFPQLQKLTLKQLEKWEELIVEEVSLPLLQSLSIMDCRKFKVLQFNFPLLQKLSIERLEELEEYIVEEGSMPLLQSLNLWDCPEFKELPDGLRFISSLKYLYMDNEWKARLSEDGEDYYKVKHIPFVNFYKGIQWKSLNVQSPENGRRQSDNL